MPNIFQIQVHINDSVGRAEHFLIGNEPTLGIFVTPFTYRDNLVSHDGFNLTVLDQEIFFRVVELGARSGKYTG